VSLVVEGVGVGADSYGDEVVVLEGTGVGQWVSYVTRG
jgi:hypothetical protein